MVIVDAWDGKERRRKGRAEELRERIENLQREWEKLGAKAHEQKALPKRRAKNAFRNPKLRGCHHPFSNHDAAHH